jgi:hypothetical protein
MISGSSKAPALQRLPSGSQKVFFLIPLRYGPRQGSLRLLV